MVAALVDVLLMALLKIGDRPRFSVIRCPVKTVVCPPFLSVGGDLFDSTAPRALQDYTSFVTDSLGVAGGVPANGIAYGVENLVVAANGQMAPEVGLVGVLQA